MAAARGLKQVGMGSYYLIHMQFQFEKMKNFWTWMVMMVEQKCEYSKCPELDT